MVILLIGYSGCGKTTIGNQLKTLVDGNLIDVSDVVRSLSKSKQIGIDQIGNKQIVKLIEKKIDPRNINIIVGIREKYIADHFIKRGANAFYLNVSEKDRFKRLANNDRKMTKKQILEKDITERQIGLSNLINFTPELIEITDSDKSDIVCRILEGISQ